MWQLDRIELENKVRILLHEFQITFNIFKRLLQKLSYSHDKDNYSTSKIYYTDIEHWINNLELNPRNFEI